MSDTMSNVEIEDVLSSIRRLVSENATRPRPTPGMAPEEDEPEASDALVLTPALRVEQPKPAAEEPAPEEDSAASAEPDPAPEAPDERALDESWQEVANTERPFWQEPETFEFATDAGEASEPPDEAEEQAEAESGDPLQSRVASIEAAYDTSDEFELDGSEVAAAEEDYDWDDEGGEDTVIDLSTPDVPAGRLHFKREPVVEPEVIELETAEEAPESLALPEDYAEEAEAEETWPEPEEDWTAPDLPRPDDSAEDEAAPVAPLVFRSAHRAPAEEAREAQSEAEDLELAADIAEAGEIGEAVAEVDFGAEDEDGDEGATLEAALVEDDGLDGYVIGTERADDEADPWEDADDAPLDEAALSAAVNAPEGAPVIDEAWLADLVTEVVRAELRGRMGERITQNVRKLVRREIARALETRGIR